MKLLRDRYKGNGRPRKVDYDTRENRMHWRLVDALDNEPVWGRLLK